MGLKTASWWAERIRKKMTVHPLAPADRPATAHLLPRLVWPSALGEVSTPPQGASRVMKSGTDEQPSALAH